MDQATYLKQRAANVAAVVSVAQTDAAQPAAPKRFILITCRDVTIEEQAVLNKQFPVVIVYHAGLNSSQMDLSAMSFDLLVIDARPAENHIFMEAIKDQASKLNIPFIVLKKSKTNSKALASALGAFVVSEIKDGANFFLTLVRSKLPRLESRFVSILKKLFALLTK
jgi:hypothetical protein